MPFNGLSAQTFLFLTVTSRRVFAEAVLTLCCQLKKALPAPLAVDEVSRVKEEGAEVGVGEGVGTGVEVGVGAGVAAGIGNSASVIDC